MTIVDKTATIQGLDPVTRRLSWAGNAVSPIWHLVNARGYCWKDLGFEAQVETLAAVLIESRDHAPGATISSDNRFENIDVQGQGKMRYGFAHGMIKDGDVVYPQWVDKDGKPKEAENNEHMVYHQCSVFNTTRAAWFSAGSQSKENSWYDCKAGSAYGGQGLMVWGGGGLWHGGAMYGFDSCFYFGSPADPFNIVGGGYESFRRLLTVEGPRLDSYNIKLEGLRVMTDACDPTGKVPMIDFRGPGPLTIIGGKYGEGGQPLPKIRMTTWQGAPAILNMLGVTIGTFDSWDRREEIVEYVGDGWLEKNIVGCMVTDVNGAARLWK